MLARISKRSVEGISPGKRDAFLWDTDLKGFGVKVTPKGKRVYVLQYRFHRRWRRYTIGPHGSPWAPDQARREAERLVGLLAVGHNPAVEKTATKNVHTVSELCDLYLAEGVATKKTSTIATDKGRIYRHIKPLLGHRSILEVSKADVEAMMNKIAEGKTAVDIKTGFRSRTIVRGGRGTATKSVTLLGAIYTFANAKGLRTDNPAHGIRKFKDAKSERFLNPEEIGRLGSVLDELGASPDFNPNANSIIRLLLLTGCRKSEIATLKWQEIDFERHCLRLGDSKTGARLVPIGKAAIDMLAELSNNQISDWLFPNITLDNAYQGTDKLWRNRIRVNAGLEDVRLHDLRHTFASVAAEYGYSQPTIAALLGHAGSGTTSRYVHFGRDPIGHAATEISAVLAGRLVGGAQIVPLRSVGHGKR